MSGREDVVVAQDLAAAIVTGGSGAAQKARGCTTARSGVGDYTVTLDPNLGGGPGVVAAECIFSLTCIGATPQIMSLEHTSDTIKTINAATNAGVAVDTDFSCLISRLVG